MGTFEHLKVDCLDNGIVRVVMDRAPANAIDRHMYCEIYRLFSDIDRYAPGARVIILCGAGRHFCAGNDLNEFATMTSKNAVERMWRVREAFFAITDCAVPVIAAIHGAALGTGIAIAASCDFIVASEDARFGLPELTVGVMGGARHLARIASQPVVRRMFFTGEPMSAAEFAAAGGSVHVCARDTLIATATAFAERIASLSPSAMRKGKEILNQIEWMDLRTGYELEQSWTVKMCEEPSSKEALMAVIEKRPARL
jgi:enoyl-CoA hydratase